MNKTTTVKLNVLATLYEAVVVAGLQPHIGHQSINSTEIEIRGLLNQQVEVNTETLMSALWSAKMLDELRLLKTLSGLTFKELLAKTLPNIDTYYFWERDHK